MGNFFSTLKEVLLTRNFLIKFVPVLIIMIALPGGVYLSQNTQIFRPRASGLDLASPEAQNIDILTQQLEQARPFGGIGILSNDDANETQRLLQVAKKRKAILLNEIDDPDSFLKKATLASKRDQFPEEVKNEIEYPVQGSGTITWHHADYFSEEVSNDYYTFESADKKVFQLVKTDEVEKELGEFQLKE